MCVSKKQPGGPCLNLRAADQRTMIMRDKDYIRNARDSYVDCIRAENVLICALLFELLAAVAPRGGDGGDSDSAGGGLLGPAATAQRFTAAVAPGCWRWRLWRW